MEPIITARADELGAGHLTSHGRSAASWGAIIAGAVIAIGVSLILLTLGAGLDFASISPWEAQGVSATTFTVTTAIALIVVQWISAGIGGYIAGRLRTRWVGTHVHEVFFRDTAHGLVTWALATVVVASIATSSLVSLMTGGVHAATQAAASGAAGVMSSASGPSANYGMDKLFRASGAVSGGTDSRGEATSILTNAVATGSLPAEDRTYLANLVAQKSGISQEEAQKRVDDWVTATEEAKTKVKEAADAARKAAAAASLYTALSLLIGAFIASISAVLGGRLRDEHV